MFQPMPSVLSLAKSHPRSLAVHAAIGAVGLIFLVDGFLRGEPRHQAVAMVLGAVLLLPMALIALSGGRALRVCNRLAFSAATFVLFLVALEVAVRTLDLRLFSYPEVVRDPVYGHVHVAGRGGLDAWGHRNRLVPESASIVCIGDSQTFGTSIRREDNYASELGRASGRGVYNMSLGGYGPLQYVELAKQALALKPEVVTLGFYFGNDLADAHRFLGLEHWAALRDPKLSYPLPNDVNHGDKRSLNLAMAVVDRVMLHSLVLRKIGNDLKLAAKLSPLLRGFVGSEKGESSYEGGEISTRLEPGFRMGCMDLARPQLKDGLRVTARCFEELGVLLDEAGVRPFLLLIHNKEFYYHGLMKQRGEAIPPSVAQLAEMERAVTAEILGLAAAAGMTVVDPTDELVGALVKNVAIYPPDIDAHLNRTGSAIAGRALSRAIEAR